jgi:hypothetical protein
MSEPKRDPRLEEMIDAAVMGEPSPWDTDEKYPGGKNLEAMFNGGDKQALLWALKFSARERKPAPGWAAEALADVLYEATTGKFESWDEGFGRIFGRKKRATMYKKRCEMLAAHDRVVELNRENPKENPIGNLLFEEVGAEFGIGKNRVAEYYARVKNYLKQRRK